MLLDAIRSLFAAPAEPEPAAPPVADGPAADPLNVAALALLLEVAHADGEFSAAERAHLEEVIERRFSLPPESGRRLMELADQERQSSIDHFRFTSTLRRGYDAEQRMELAEILWGLVLADGTVAEHEHYLARKIANLLELSPAELSAAKAAALRLRSGNGP